jgi:O-antigen/teichoic acid export membrane protein
MSKLKQLAGQTAIYGISSILGRTVNFLLVPLYTAYLTKETLGAYTALYAYVALFNILFTYGMETTFFRFASGKNLSKTLVFAQIQSLLITTSIVFGGMIFLFSPQIAEFLGYPNQSHLFKWLAIILSLDALMVIPYAKLRQENKAFKFALTKLGNILLNVFFNVFFIVICSKIASGEILNTFQSTISTFYRPEWEVEYIILSNLLANAVLLPVLLYYSGKFIWTWNSELIKSMWKYAYPLLFMGLAGTINEAFSRGLFEYVLPQNFYLGYNSRQAAGIFGANFKLAILMSLIIQSFKYAAEPFFFQESNSQKSPPLFAKVMHAFIIFCSTLMILVSVNLQILGPLFLRGDGYASALHIVPVLMLGYLLLGIYFNLSIWFKITDQTKYSFYFTLVGAFVTLISIFTLIPLWGYMGGALSTMLCYLSMSILCFIYGQKKFPVPYRVGKGVLYLVLAISLSYAPMLFQLENPILDFITKNSMVLGFVIVVLSMEKVTFAQFKNTISR